MNSPDLHALADSLTGASPTDLADAFANFSMDMLQQANALLTASSTTVLGQGPEHIVGDGDTLVHLADIETAAALSVLNSDTSYVNRTLETQCLQQAELVSSRK